MSSRNSSSVKTQPRKRLVVVLGMHRSGSSAVARGLQALGVDLGPRLLPPAPDNVAGFWEDADANALNIEILHALRRDWDSLEPIRPSELTRAELDPFRIRAIDLLRQRLQRKRIFGLKDPRLCILLPFWRPVFVHLALETSYVICIRHPLSVARSLQKRGGTDPEKSHYLWLEHVAAAFLDSRSSPRIVLDYDLLMKQPQAQLMRIAKALKLPVEGSSAAIAQYARQFLSKDLRHTFFDFDDLKHAPEVPPDVVEAYALARKLATDEVSPDAEKVQAFFLEAMQRLGNARPAFALALRSQAVVAERDGQVHVLNLAVAERDRQLMGLNQAAAERDRQLRGLGEAIAERDARIHAFELEISSRDGKIHGLNLMVAERDRQIAGLAQALAGRDGKIAGLDAAALQHAAAVAEREARIHALELEVASRDGKIHGANIEAAERAGQIVGLTQAVAERDGHIRNLSEGAAQSEAKSHALELEISGRDGKIHGLNLMVAERDRQIAGLSRAVAQHEEQRSGLSQALVEREAQVANLEARVASRDGKVRDLQQGMAHLLREVRSSLLEEASHASRMAASGSPGAAAHRMHELAAAWEDSARELSRIAAGLADPDLEPADLEVGALSTWMGEAIAARNGALHRVARAGEDLSLHLAQVDAELEIGRLRLLDSLRALNGEISRQAVLSARVAELEGVVANQRAEIQTRDRILGLMEHRFVSRLGAMFEPYARLRAILRVPVKMLRQIGGQPSG